MSQYYPPDNSNQPWNTSQYPPYQPPQPYYPQQPGQFIQPPSPKRTLRQRFKILPKKTKAGIGCGSLLLILSLCICTAVASTANSSSHPTQLASVTTPTTTSKTVALSKPSPTAKPKPTAKPQPTVKPTAAPTAIPTQPPVPTQPPAPPAPTSPPVQTGVNNNPWGYDFNPGTTITDPPASFCTYFNCIASFWNGHGYVDECNDLTYSKSGGLSGACSKHGGEMRALYSH